MHRQQGNLENHQRENVAKTHADEEVDEKEVKRQRWRRRVRAHEGIAVFLERLLFEAALDEVGLRLRESRISFL